MTKATRGPDLRLHQRRISRVSNFSMDRALEILADPIKAWHDMPHAELGGSLSGDTFQMVRQGKWDEPNV